MARKKLIKFIVNYLEQNGEASSGEIKDAFNKRHARESASINEVTGHCVRIKEVVCTGQVTVPSTHGGRTHKIWSLA